MSAIAAEKWADRLFIALKGTTGSVPREMMHLGIVAVAVRGINTFLAADIDWSKFEPLLDEMMACVKIIRDKSHPEVATDILEATDDIEEVQTILWLRGEILRVHTGFPVAESLSKLISAIQAPAT